MVMFLPPLDAGPTKTSHGSVADSLRALFEEWAYGDGWRLVEIVLGAWVVLRGIAILLFGGMGASYYAAFPGADTPAVWGVAGLMIGGGRIAGTIINGRWKRSPRLRWTAGIFAIAWHVVHFAIFAQMGLTLIALGSCFWAVLEFLGVLRSSIDIIRKRDEQCRSG